MIDLSTVRILNSPDVHGWPATAEITLLSLQPTGVHVEFTKDTQPGGWPDIPFGDPGDHGSLLFTLWIVLNVGGEWLAAGCIEFWRGLFESGGPVNGYAKNWYYDPNRWPGMAGHQPAVGERVGFFVTSGDARHGDDGVGLHERSNIVAIDFPDAAGWTYAFPSSEPAHPPDTPATPDPPATPPTPPAPPAEPAPPKIFDVDVDVFFESLERIVLAVETMAKAAAAAEQRLERLEKSGVKVHL